MGIFGDLFDFNGDGKLDAIEQGAELGFIMEVIESEEDEDEDEYDEDEYEFDDD